MNWWLTRFREPSTWRGLVWLATVAGLSLRPDQAEAVVTLGMALAGLLGVFLSDARSVAVERAPVGTADDPVAPRAAPVRNELPSIELVGTPLGATGRAPALDSGLADQRTVPGRPADELRLQAERRPGPAGTADPNTYPRFGAGFGDRD